MIPRDHRLRVQAVPGAPKRAPKRAHQTAFCGPTTGLNIFGRTLSGQSGFAASSRPWTSGSRFCSLTPLWGCLGPRSGSLMLANVMKPAVSDSGCFELRRLISAMGVLWGLAFTVSAFALPPDSPLAQQESEKMRAVLVSAQVTPAARGQTQHLQATVQFQKRPMEGAPCREPCVSGGVARGELSNFRAAES